MTSSESIKQRFSIPFYHVFGFNLFDRLFDSVFCFLWIHRVIIFVGTNCSFKYVNDADAIHATIRSLSSIPMTLYSTVLKPRDLSHLRVGSAHPIYPANPLFNFIGFQGRSCLLRHGLLEGSIILHRHRSK